MKKSVLLICIVSLFMWAGCGPKTGRTAKGYEYTLVTDSKTGQQVKGGDIVSFNIAFYLNDTLKDARPLEQEIPGDVGKNPYPPFIELLSLLKVGDSAFVLVRLDTMKNLSPQYKKTDIVKYSVKVNSIADKALVAKQKAEKEAAAAELSKSKGPILDKLKATAADYSNGKLKDTKKTPSGIQYIILEEGKGGAHIKNQGAKVHYIGVTKDGKEFDSSLTRGEPIPVQVGTGGVIAGWDEILMTLQVGTKAIVIIPSALAYGEKGAGNGAIPPNSDLLFYMDIVE